jgi:hypothetical protein
MKRKNIEQSIVARMVAVTLLVFPATVMQAQDKPASSSTSTYSQSNPDATKPLIGQPEGISSKDVNKGIRDAYRVNSPVKNNHTEANRNSFVTPDKNPPLGNSLLFIDLGPNKTYDALGNSPVNNSSGAYNPRQAVNMPQSTITQPPLPYKNGGTYYQANDSLLRPPRNAQ